MKHSILQFLKNTVLGVDYDNEEDIYNDLTETEPEEEDSPDVVKESYPGEITSLDAVRGRKSMESDKSKILNFRSGIKLQVMITYPKEITDAPAICDYLHEGSACVVNLDGVDRAAAQRIADFLGGSIYALNGEIQRISNTIFIAAPANVNISGELEDELKTSGVIFPWIASSFR